MKPNMPACIPPSVRDAALVYAEHGWYVLPIHRGKHAGSFLGKGWPDKSTRDPEQITAWWTQPELGIAVHVGRSGAIAFDADNPQHMPKILVDAIADNRPPFQSTRANDILRGHYLFALPAGIMLGNSLGGLRTDPPWGDVRGRNGIIVAAPTQRPADKRYRWIRTGALPELPAELVRALLRKRRTVRHEPLACSPVYTHQRIRGLLTKLLNAPDDNQNNMLHWTACRFGEMVANGLIDEQTAFDTLLDVGLQLPSYDPRRPWRENDIRGTVTSGLSTGMLAA